MSVKKYHPSVDVDMKCDILKGDTIAESNVTHCYVESDFVVDCNNI